LQLGGGSLGRKYRNMLRKVSIRWSYLGHGSSGNTVTLACLMDLLLAFRTPLQAFKDEAHLWIVGGAKGLAGLELGRIPSILV